jgi:NAD(P)-dependent dehydrogenase (short-subunit alcohol dehydrogenase family)
MTDRAPLALVTGGNRGLGLETCRMLAVAGYEVILASRREKEGRRAAETLAHSGLAVAWRPLDVGDPASIASFAKRLSEERVEIAALVNNAGVYHEELDGRTARATVDVNFLGPLRLTEALAPLLAPHARIVMVSSGMGELVGLPASWRSRFEAPLDLEALVQLEAAFVAEVERGEHAREGSALSYRVSKCGLNVLTRLLARTFMARGVMVNAVCPGWVRTEMGGAGATREIPEGTAGIAWAATLPPGGPTGGFFRDGRAIDW